MAKCGKIHSIVRLQQTLRRWRSRAAAAPTAAPAPVPSGHVAVCVGGASRRFLVRAAHLNHPVFRELLLQSEEEYGFPSTPGPVALPCCDEDRFLDVLRFVSSEDRLLRRSRSVCCRMPVVTSREVAARPLLQGMAVEKLVW
ncbi:auxin-induced protein X10A-like [Triticum dicoccoides]|uniref:auxin-induced protein X10A-like n=1 Tax=Triticum dicoccoides TaxID=85692 RepID=UPI00188E8108|nr:auxin-induced protein X10A-like [Triticum dicoccoides]